jgi:hypothetical protein
MTSPLHPAATIADAPAALFDSTQHRAPPVELRWAMRDGATSYTCWVFFWCCGALGNEYAGHVVSSRGSITSSIARALCGQAAELPQLSSLCELPKSHHPGQLELLRNSRNQACKAAVVAKWTCCGKTAVPNWDSSWDTQAGAIP